MMKVDKIEFSIVSPEMVKKLAAAKLTKTELYDQEGYPIEGGLMDPRLGVIDPGVRCRTCAGNVGECYGHFGYLELTRPIIHVHYSKIIFALIKTICRKCSRILIDPKDMEKVRAKRLSFKEFATASKKKCPFCNTEQKKLKMVKPYSIFEGAEMLNALVVRERLEKMTDDDLNLIGLKSRPEWLCLTLLPIPPVTVRPSITLETGERSEDDLTHKLVDIVRINDRLRENIDLGAPDFIIEDLWELLQYHVSTYFDNELTGIPPARHRSGRTLKTISQRLKTKEGRFRGNLAGKRVNFCARTVISPDPMIEIDEVGVPEVIARELTKPVRVTENNIEELRKIVLLGPEGLQGVNYVIRSDGRRKKVTDSTKEEIAKELTPGYIIERHLQDGDIVLFNRQPSLHRMSLMGHRVRVMPWKTFRINLSTTTPYNADFDGDEMNLHLPQTEEAKVEIENLTMVPKNIRSPRFSGPIIGGIRDHITGLYLLTQDNVKLSRKDFIQLIRSVDLNVPIPDKEFLTGKEIFSIFLPKDFTIDFKSNTGEHVVIEDGKLLKGAIDKIAVGAEVGKLIDKIEKFYGSDYTKRFIYNFTRLAINYLMIVGFSISTSDQDLSDSARKDIKDIIEKIRKDVDDLNIQYEKGNLKLLVGRSSKESLNHMIKTLLRNGINDAQKVLEMHMHDSNTMAMVKSGARGSLVNLVQTSALVGQEMVMGERIEKGYYQRTFPHVKPNQISLEATGFVSRGFKDGLTPFEFFFDAINSRESLMDKSLKTRHSGYMERRLVGALQDLKVEYDGTVRDGANRIVQFVPGEDGLDPSKIQRVGIDVRAIAKKLD